jgi:MATE family multidrug resistance protein
MNARVESDEVLEEGGYRQVISLAWPLVLSMLGYTMMGLADTLMVGWIGPAEVAGVGLGTVASFTLTCLGVGLLNGVKVVTSQSVGAGRPVRAYEAARQGVVLAVVLGVAMTALAPWADSIIFLMSDDPLVVAHGTAYFETRLWGAIPLLIGVPCFAYFDGLGRTRVSMVAMLIANGIHIVFAYLLIYGIGPFPALGVRGAAISTVFSQIVQGAIGLYLLHVYGRECRSPLRFDGVGELLRLGVPMGLRMSLETQSWAILCGIVARAGTAHIAAHTIAVRICSISFMPGHALGETACILVGQAVGGGRWDLARRVVNTVTRVTALAMGAIGVFLVIGSERLIALFGAEPDILQIGGQLLVIAAAFQLFDAIAMVRAGALNGAGSTRFVMLTSVGLAWGVLPAVWYLANERGLGAAGAWLVLTGQIALLALILGLRWRWRSVGAKR